MQERLGCLRRPRSGAVRSFPAYGGDASVPTPHHPNPRPYGIGDLPQKRTCLAICPKNIPVETPYGTTLSFFVFPGLFLHLAFIGRNDEFSQDTLGSGISQEGR